MVTINEIVKAAQRRNGRTTEEADLVSYLVCQAELSIGAEKEIRLLLDRRADCLRKRETRYYRRNRQIDGEPVAADSRRPMRPSQLDDRRIALELAMQSAFDEEHILAEAHVHPKFKNFAEFANARHYCSRGEAFKRRKEFRKRAKQLYSNLLNSQQGAGHGHDC